MGPDGAITNTKKILITEYDKTFNKYVIRRNQPTQKTQKQSFWQPHRPSVNIREAQSTIALIKVTVLSKVKIAAIISPIVVIINHNTPLNKSGISYRPNKESIKQ